MALVRRRLSFSLLRQAMNTTAKLSAVLVSSWSGRACSEPDVLRGNGPVWVSPADELAGGQLGFLIVVKTS